jgi:peptide/nickel transport system substrate-binding protein
MLLFSVARAAVALLHHSRISTQVYASLVSRDPGFALESTLALSSQATDSRTWRLRLRPNVRLHDGTAFGADDAVFSIERALAKSSQRAFQLRGVTGARKVDDLTIWPNDILELRLVNVR